MKVRISAEAAMNEIPMTFEEEIDETIKCPHDFYPKDIGKVVASFGDCQYGKLS